MKLRQNTSWIEEANELVNISDVLTSLGVFVPGYIGNKKVHCPFGFYHSDNGLSKAMRVYPHTNSAYCFSCGKSYSPVSLYAASQDCSYVSAALSLLEDAGYKPKTVQERWQEAVAEKVIPVDVLELSEALKIFCSGICPEWEVRQLDNDVAELLGKCLSLVEFVKTDEDADKWLSACKKVMQTKLKDAS